MFLTTSVMGLTNKGLISASIKIDSLTGDDSAPGKDSNKLSTRRILLRHAIGQLAMKEVLIMNLGEYLDKWVKCSTPLKFPLKKKVSTHTRNVNNGGQKYFHN